MDRAGDLEGDVVPFVGQILCLDATVTQLAKAHAIVGLKIGQRPRLSTQSEIFWRDNYNSLERRR